LDALPSQLNSSVIKINKMGILYGQCSEVCGVNHSFMPIKLESIKIKNFINLIK
jgi:heme/copper-type cytochrome/quinol oxidase subunit 2